MSEGLKKSLEKAFGYKYAVKHYLWENQKSLCAICNQRISWKNSSIDHIIPRSKGGMERLANYQLVHKQCNELKADNLNECNIKVGMTMNHEGFIAFKKAKRRKKRKQLLISILTLKIIPIIYKYLKSR